MTADPGFSNQHQLDIDVMVDGLASLADLPPLAARVREKLAALLEQRECGRKAATLISAVNDRLTVKIIELVRPLYRLPEVAWCWLAFGSEGREEQTLITDQDNGLVFEASSQQEAEALRGLFLPFAQAVNEQLDLAGFSRCQGGIMAGNPACCRAVDEWREQFIDWVRRPDPQALLNATIFFDLRPLYGAENLGKRLQNLFLSLSQDTPAFQHLMAGNALQVTVPLNFLGDLSISDSDEIDLKKFGSRVFVDVARIFALEHGVSAVTTSERLALTATKVGLASNELAAMDVAFSQILRLRLEHQLAAKVWSGGQFQELRPGNLNDMDRAILREALKQARRLQQRLKLNYSL